MKSEVKTQDSKAKSQKARHAIPQSVLKKAAELARQAAKKAYAPYSGFKVGAALVTGSGRVFTGCNVENASYGLTLCAERAAIAKAVSEGERDFELMVICTPTQAFTPPCGACRQVMAEFAPELAVVLVNKTGRQRRYRLSDLLPVQFR